VPIIVAINKIDKDTANPERVMQQLSEIGLLPEEWGGDTIYCRISALKNEGIDELLDMILLVSELRELKANYNRLASGTVIEAKLDRGRGPVATLLVQNGTLRVGDSIVVGTTYGRVRAMTNEWGKPLKEATPSTPVEIIGLQSVPQAGDRFMVFADDKEARKIAEARAEKQREKELKPGRALTLDDLFAQIQEGELKELNLIIKADVQGTAEALGAALMKINVEGVKINIIRQAVGAITESDVTLASASHAIIIGFNVRPTGRTRELAKEEGVDIRLHNVIYKVIEEIEAAMKGLLDPVYEEKVIGEAEVRETFKVSRIGTIAGCYVANGVVRRNSLCRVIREGVVIYEGKINSLRRFKDDVREVAQGYECGMTIENFNDIKVGDVIECYIMEEVEQ
ncbi:MAG TPA: translation initiation factor IF-2, partial [Haloplasmataceae bacterium]